MDVYRITSPAHAVPDGVGAAGSDSARWNSKGRYVVYAAEHYATALLEKAAQLNAIRIPRSLVFVRITIPPDASVEEVRVENLDGWDSDDRRQSRAFGDRWYDERRSLVLLVPSLVAPGLERNALINRRHPAFDRVMSSAAEAVRCHPGLTT